MPLYNPVPAASGSTPGLVKLPAASVTFTPSNPTGITATSLVMMGLGQQATPVVFTPTSTGIVEVTLAAWYNIATTANQVSIGARYGTGTAPTGPLSVTISSGTGSAALFTAAQSYVVGQALYVSGTGQPGNFTNGTTYYVCNSPAPTGSAFYLTTTAGGVGTAVAYSSAGTAVTVAPPATGTRFGGNTEPPTSPASTVKYEQAVFTHILTGQALSTALWFDLVMATSNAADVVSAESIIVTCKELVA